MTTVYLHACGNLSELLVDLCEAGVDLLDNKQPALWMESSAVDAVRGKIAFSTCVDIQSVMPSIALGRIADEVRRLVRRLATPQGGFVAKWYDKPDLCLDPQKIKHMVEAFSAFDWGKGKTWRSHARLL